MRFSQTTVHQAFVIELEPRVDERGFFARAWCQEEFEACGLTTRIAQVNMAGSKRKGTLRGMHFQRSPCEEVKVVFCTRGAVYDVALDLRGDSPTYKQWAAVELTADNHCMFYVPAGCAHGYQTLADDTELWYLTSQFYSPQSSFGLRYDDPAFGIEWPLDVDSISEADWSWPPYEATPETTLGRELKK